MGLIQLRDSVVSLSRLSWVTILFILWFFAGRPMMAQSDPYVGIPRFSTQIAGRYDSVAPATSNILISLPIRDKAGKIPVSLKLLSNFHVHDSSPSTPANWVGTPGSLMFNLTVTAADLGAVVGYNFASTPFPCKPGEFFSQYSNFVVFDETGAVHQTTPALIIYTDPSCGAQQGTVQTVDGSGYTVNLAITQTSQGPILNSTLVDKSGNVLNRNLGNPQFSAADPDGVQVSSSGTHQGQATITTITDSLGQTALTSTINAFSPGSPATYQYTDVNGKAQTVTIYYSQYSIQTNFGCSGIADDAGTDFLPSSIVMADGETFQISYEPTPGNSSAVTGRIAKLTLPLGGSISYSYSGGNNGIYCGTYGNPHMVPTLKRTVDDGNGNVGTWTYVNGYTGTGSSNYTVSETDPQGNVTVYNFTSSFGTTTSGTWETERQIYQGAASSQNLLKTIITCYNGNFSNCPTASAPLVPGLNIPGVTQTDVYTYFGGSASPSLVETKYNLSANSQGVPITLAGTVAEVKEYDFGATVPPSGSPLRDTTTIYGTWNGTSCAAIANIVDHPCEITTVNSSGTTVEQTQFTYNAAGHPTQISRLVRGSAYVTTSAAYASNGAITSSTDANGTITNYTNGACNGLMRTQTTTASLTTQQAWNCNGGVITSTTDANGNVTNYSYQNSSGVADPLWRLISVAYPDGGQTTAAYNLGASPPNITTTSLIDSSDSLVTQTNFDGLGRVVQKSTTSDPQGTDSVATTYDALGHAASVTNPFRQTSDPTYGATTYQYDALGRVTQTTKQDNSVTSAQYDQTSLNSPNGDCAITTDEAGKSRKSCVDGLGRLIEVDEPQASSGSLSSPYVTLYSYDALGNLLSVNQKGDGSQTARARNFTYDSLSRLLTASNPESGQISYSYDGNGNLLQKTSPAPNQTNATTTQTISYCYDVHNRVTGKAYSAQTCANGQLPSGTAAVTYTYDSGTNGAGYLTSLTDAVGSGSYTYDDMGRIAGESRTINGNTKAMSYVYNLDGSLRTLTYPSGAVITYTPDAVGRAGMIQDLGNSINYVTGTCGANGSSICYTPTNEPGSLLSGMNSTFAGIANSFTFNTRLQPVNISATSPGCTGSGCTASVIINGALGTASANGGSIELAALQSLSSLVDAGGYAHIFYLGINQHAYDLFATANGWNNRDLGATAAPVNGNASPAGNSHLSSALLGTQSPAPQLFYEATNQDLYHLFVGSAGWEVEDLTIKSGAGNQPAAGTPLGSLNSSSQGSVSAYYLGTNQHIYSMFWNGSGWVNQDLTATATALNGNLPAATGSALSSAFFGTQNPQSQVFYQANNQDLYHLFLASGGWDAEDLTIKSGASNQPAAGASLASLGASGQGSVSTYYLGANQHIYTMFWNGSSWVNQDLTATATALNGDLPAATGSALSSTVFGTGSEPQVFYQASNQDLYHLFLGSGGWDAEDLTLKSGTGTQPAAGTPLTSVGNSNQGSISAFYLGANQHIYSMFWNGSAWANQDLTAAARQVVADSGVVSLSVGGFTATACFGASTNPACTGQAVNNGPVQVAAALAQALNTSGSPVTATASGTTINMTWNASGSQALPISPLSTTHDNPSLFAGPSFTSASADFIGGSSLSLPVFNISYNFNLGNGDNGNVIGITNNRDNTRSQTFTYDALNRLTSAQNAGTDCTQTAINGGTKYWGNSYGYDAWGNLLQKAPTKCSAENLNVSASTLNQIHSINGPDYAYDAAGNMTRDATTGNNYTYDPENRIMGAVGFTYKYDADGNRVEKTDGSTGTIYWYMTPGVVAESDLSGNLQSEYVFFNGERVARKDFPSNAVSYYFSDNLRTASIITDSAGNTREDEDYYPWGGELQFVNNDSNHYKFGGHERDNETGLDYMLARYYSNPLGRFLTPDWAAKPITVPYANFGNPQSLNLYTFGKNNPRTFGDPDGHCCFLDDLKEALTGAGNRVLDTIATPISWAFNRTAPSGVEMTVDHAALAPKNELQAGGAQIADVVMATAPILVPGTSVAVRAVSATVETESIAPTVIDTVDSSSLATRASEIHSVLDPIAQEMRTTAVANVTNGDGTTSTLAASSRNTLSPAQRSALQPGETAVSGQGHAETTILDSAQQNGQTVNSMGVTRTPCPNCQQRLDQAGVDVTVKKTPE